MAPFATKAEEAVQQACFCYPRCLGVRVRAGLLEV
jgi:hypothetical protein